MEDEVIYARDKEQDYINEMIEILKRECESIKLEDLLLDFKSADGYQIFTIPTIGKPIKFIHEDH